MTDQVRIGVDGSELPRPVSKTDELLAAIFDELRELRLHGLSSPAVEPEAEEIVDVREVMGYAAESVPAGETAVIELTAEPVDNSPGVVSEEEASEAARALSLSDEVASEAGRTLAVHKHDDAAEPETAAVPAKAGKPAAKKPAAKPRRTTRKRAK